MIDFNEAGTQGVQWQRWPETEADVGVLIDSALSGNSFATMLASRMQMETSTRFADWVDHLVVFDRSDRIAQLERLGYRREPELYAPECRCSDMPAASSPGSRSNPGREGDTMSRRLP